MNELNFQKANVELRNLSVNIKETRILDDINLVVQSGEIISLLGPSGCGKTTMLRVIAGLQETSVGMVLVDDKTINEIPPYRRAIGMVFQNYALFPHMTVCQNVEFGLKMQGLKTAARDTMINESLEMLDLEALRDHYPAQLSGGQQQRVAVARAIATRPSVILLDEPLSALDKKLREGMRTELRDLLKKVGITTILVTHDQEEALAVADRVAVMNKGRIEQIGTGSELYDTPRTRFVADFVGYMNYFKGRLINKSSRSVDIDIGAGRTLTSPVQRSYQVGVEAEFTIRPERITVRADMHQENDDQSNIISAKFIREEYLGILTYMRFVDTEGQEILVINAGKQQAGPLTPGQWFKLTWPVVATSMLDNVMA